MVKTVREIFLDEQCSLKCLETIMCLAASIYFSVCYEQLGRVYFLMLASAWGWFHVCLAVLVIMIIDEEDQEPSFIQHNRIITGIGGCWLLLLSSIAIGCYFSGSNSGDKFIESEILINVQYFKIFYGLFKCFLAGLVMIGDTGYSLYKQKF